MRPVLFALLALFVLSACVAPRRARTRTARPVAKKPAAPSTPSEAAVRTGWFRKGLPVSEATVLAAAPRAALVVFGEIHGTAEGSAAELKVLKAVHAAHPKMALAMEFFERDTQADLDAYLTGELPEAEFMERTRRSKAYAATHGPLIEYCKANGIAVIAANAPRRLVTGYRKFEGDYQAYRLSLSETDLSYVSDETSTPDDAYRKRFYDLMGPKRAPTFFKSQALWDDTMAESIARYRNQNPDHVVMFIVGAFHVRGGLGTITKYRQRRPGDSVSLVVMDRSGADSDLDTDDTFSLRVDFSTKE